MSLIRAAYINSALLCLPHSVISFAAINFSSISQLFVFTPDFVLFSLHSVSGSDQFSLC